MKCYYDFDFKREHIAPFHIYGGLYYVGQKFGPSYLLNTDAGLILFDTGITQVFHLVLESLRQLGFTPYDVKYLIHSHGHFDHTGGSAAMQALTGAKTFIGRDDAELARGNSLFTWAREFGFPESPAFEPDVLLDDGDTITLGKTAIKCLHTPGHTAGTMSYFFDVEEDGKVLQAGTHGGVGLNAMGKEYLDEYGLSYDCRDKYLTGLERLKKEHVNVFFSNHLNPEMPPCVDSLRWNAYLDSCRDGLLKIIAEDK